LIVLIWRFGWNSKHQLAKGNTKKK